MLDLVVAQLKTGPWVRVVPFGSAQPSLPYLVVREEGGNFRVTGHHKPDYYVDLRAYMRKEVYNLLQGRTLTGSGARIITIREVPGSLTECRALSDDGSISIERVFYSPDILTIGDIF